MEEEEEAVVVVVKKPTYVYICNMYVCICNRQSDIIRNGELFSSSESVSHRQQMIGCLNRHSHLTKSHTEVITSSTALVSQDAV